MNLHKLVIDKLSFVSTYITNPFSINIRLVKNNRYLPVSNLITKPSNIQHIKQYANNFTHLIIFKSQRI